MRISPRTASNLYRKKRKNTAVEASTSRQTKELEKTQEPYPTTHTNSRTSGLFLPEASKNQQDSFLPSQGIYATKNWKPHKVQVACPTLFPLAGWVRFFHRQGLAFPMRGVGMFLLPRNYSRYKNSHLLGMLWAKNCLLLSNYEKSQGQGTSLSLILERGCGGRRQRTDLPERLTNVPRVLQEPAEE
jgi:hypothetical protein